jgi:hypothetical protein
MVEMLLQARANAGDRQVQENMPPPGRRQGSSEIVRMLLEARGHVNAKDEAHQTCLHLAAEQGSSGVLKILLEARADVGAKDKECNTALELTKDAAMFDCLLTGGAKMPDVTDLRIRMISCFDMHATVARPSLKRCSRKVLIWLTKMRMRRRVCTWPPSKGTVPWGESLCTPLLFSSRTKDTCTPVR